MTFPVVKDQARLWRIDALQGIALFSARFKDFAFSRHEHEEFGIGVIERGTQTFQVHGTTYYAPPGAMISVNPDTIHDGRAATETGYQYRMAYIPAAVVQELMRGSAAAGRGPGYFRNPLTIDPELSPRLLHALQLMDRHPPELLAAQTVFFETIAQMFARHAHPRYVTRPVKPNPGVVRKARELIHASATENLSLQELAAAVGVSRFHFLRLFKASTGLTPHEYLLMHRLELVKSLLKQGYPLAGVAQETGFADQSHMTRRFKAAFGVTPGQYQQALCA